jgi:putative transcriptional regulator
MKAKKIQCAMCDNPADLPGKRIRHNYKESGLSNIVLEGVMSYKCGKCGELHISLSNVLQLHQAIADMLLQKKELLTGAEVRFLRTHIGLSGAEFARLIDYDSASLYRLENGQNRITRTFDRLVRFTVAAKEPDRNYNLHDMLLKESGPSFERIRLKETRGVWKASAQAA